MVLDLHVLPCFSHMIMKRKSVSREMYTFLEEKLWRLRRKTYEVNDIPAKNPTALQTVLMNATKYIASKKTFRESFLFCPLKANTWRSGVNRGMQIH